MRPIFTIHAGEYLVASHIEQKLTDPDGNKVNVWVPSKDTGIDLLITDKTNKKTTSIQIKFSKDFLVTHGDSKYKEKLISCGWWNLNRSKILNSKADYWIFVLHTFNAKNMQYIILTPQELIQRLDAVHLTSKPPQIYLWVSSEFKCWETRGLKKHEIDKLILNNAKISSYRDFTEYLNNWNVLFSKWI